MKTEERVDVSMIEHKQPTTELHFVSYLSPLLYTLYEHIATYVGEHIGLPTTLSIGQSLEDFAAGRADVGFLCGLVYVQMTNWSSCPVELVAAPVLQGERYHGAPLYFSDVIVRRDSPYTSFKELRGCVWAYNETASHSGYNLVRYSLLQRGLKPDYFRWAIATGSHLQSLQAIVNRLADATAIDSHVLDVLRQKQPELVAQLRVIDVFGPSHIPPVVVSKTLEPPLRQKIGEVLMTMHHDSQAAQRLHEGLIERFVLITDKDYDEIRRMFSLVQSQE